MMAGYMIIIPFNLKICFNPGRVKVSGCPKLRYCNTFYNGKMN